MCFGCRPIFGATFQRFRFRFCLSCLKCWIIHVIIKWWFRLSAEGNKSLSSRCQLVASGTRSKLWRIRPSDIFHLVSEGTNIVPTFQAATSSTLSGKKGLFQLIFTIYSSTAQPTFGRANRTPSGPQKALPVALWVSLRAHTQSSHSTTIQVLRDCIQHSHIQSHKMPLGSKCFHREYILMFMWRL